MRASATALRFDFTMRDIALLTRSGLTGMVVVSTAVGMLFAARGTLPMRLWLCTLLGTWGVAAGASVLNQVVEREADARMRRTANRPIPAGRLHPDVGLLIGVGLAVSGLTLLATMVNLSVALLGALTLAAYIFVYTPLKRRHSLATVVGAVPGALPPVMGWVAVTGTIDPGAWALFALLFFWQMPHFLAIAWLYRADYERGGFPVLSVKDPDGYRTSRQALFYTAALVPVSLLPSALGLTSGVYFVGALLLGLGYLSAAGRFALRLSPTSARHLLLVSVFYLPLIMSALVLDRLL